MRRSPRTGPLAACLIATVVLVAACGGGSTPSGSAPIVPGSPAQASDLPATAAPTAAPPSDATEPSLGAIPTFDLDDLVANLEGVDAYRLVVTINGEAAAYESKVLTKPELARDITVSDGGTTTRIVVIGDEAWMGMGDSLQPAPAEMATAMLTMSIRC